MHLHLCLNGPMEEVKRCQQEECLAAAAVMEVAVAGERQAYHEEFGEEEGAFAVDAFAVEMHLPVWHIRGHIMLRTRTRRHSCLMHIRILSKMD